MRENPRPVLPASTKNRRPKAMSKPEATSFEGFAQSLTRLAEAHDRIVMEIPTIKIFQIVGAIQLALRHPDFPSSSAETCMEFLRQLQSQLAGDYPVLAQLIEQGFDPAYDTK
jgi:hypothetical protein